MGDVDWTVLGPQLATALAAILAAERSRSGLTDAEIFERAGIKHDENIARLVADMERLKAAQPS